MNWSLPRDDEAKMLDLTALLAEYAPNMLGPPPAGLIRRASDGQPAEAHDVKAAEDQLACLVRLFEPTQDDFCVHKATRSSHSRPFNRPVAGPFTSASENNARPPSSAQRPDARYPAGRRVERLTRRRYSLFAELMRSDVSPGYSTRLRGSPTLRSGLQHSALRNADAAPRPSAVLAAIASAISGGTRSVSRNFWSISST